MISNINIVNVNLKARSRFGKGRRNSSGDVRRSDSSYQPSSFTSTIKIQNSGIEIQDSISIQSKWYPKTINDIRFLKYLLYSYSIPSFHASSETQTTEHVRGCLGGWLLLSIERLRALEVEIISGLWERVNQGIAMSSTSYLLNFLPSSLLNLSTHPPYNPFTPLRH